MTEQKVKSDTDNCPVCGGDLAPGKYHHVVGGDHIGHQISGEIRWLQHIILDVPALICTSCGSPWVQEDDGVLEKLQAYIGACAEQDVFVSTVNYSSISETAH